MFKKICRRLLWEQQILDEGSLTAFYPFLTLAFALSTFCSSTFSLAHCQYISSERQLLSGWNRFLHLISQLGSNLLDGADVHSSCRRWLIRGCSFFNGQVADSSQIWQVLPGGSFIINVSVQFIKLCFTLTLETHISHHSSSHVNIKKSWSKQYSLQNINKAHYHSSKITIIQWWKCVGKWH